MPTYRDSHSPSTVLNMPHAHRRANHAGYMTHAQMDLLKDAKHKRIGAYIGRIMVYGTWLIALIFLTINQIIWFKIFLSLLILPIFVLLSIAIHNLKWEMQNQPIFSGEISSQTGIIKAHKILSNWGALSNIQINTDGDIFRLPSDIVSRLTIGQVYTVHYLADTKTIVSIEKADSNTSIDVIEEELAYLEAVQSSLKTGYSG